jgi:cell division protein ZapA
MSEPINIRIHVADKVYPLKVTPDEEERIRKAANRLNDRIRQHRQTFEVQDKHDLLAMCALEFATEVEEHEEKNHAYQQELRSSIKAIEDVLNTSQ